MLALNFIATASEVASGIRAEGGPPRKSNNQYKFIDKVRYERDLLEAAEEFEKKDGRIDISEARKLWELANDGRGVTPTERRTLEYILKHNKLTVPASKYLQGETEQAPDSQEQEYPW